ncbi:hypothetical protein JHD46_05390 [Sulfurimonas sp. SAG-AH-194-C20]|nr:hypothetical protein [Sulfurimonas sp. SAG-AH-194-C20]MDF1879073.1 hypothetical protein [Sulfurimonas sp. SAG-AH-194-C20]
MKIITLGKGVSEYHDKYGALVISSKLTTMNKLKVKVIYSTGSTRGLFRLLDMSLSQIAYHQIFLNGILLKPKTEDKGALLYNTKNIWKITEELLYTKRKVKPKRCQCCDVSLNKKDLYFDNDTRYKVCTKECLTIMMNAEGNTRDVIILNEEDKEYKVSRPLGWNGEKYLIWIQDKDHEFCAFPNDVVFKDFR